MTEIKDRQLSTVSVTSIEMDWQPGKVMLVGGMCHVSLTGPEGGEDGPAANIFFGVPVDPAMPLQDVARATLARVHAILQRMASFSVDEFEKCFVEWREKTAEERERSASMGFPKNERG